MRPDLLLQKAVIASGRQSYLTLAVLRLSWQYFRWCPSFPEYFAISTSSMSSKGAVINVNSVYHLQTQATSIQIAPRPHRVTDFDWIGTRGTPRLAAAVGREIYIFPISVE